MKKHGLETVPKCYRATLRTSRQVIKGKKCGDDYVYLGLLNSNTLVLHLL